MISDNIYKNIGVNIKSLRESFGQTQLDLALDIGIGSTAISQYESGKRIPDRDILLKIAKHFRLTENELIYGDFTYLKKLPQTQTNTLPYNPDLLRALFPIIVSNSALENEYFNRAYNKHLEIVQTYIDKSNIDESEIDLCLELYETAINEGIAEAMANTVWWIIVEAALFSFLTPKMIWIFDLKETDNISLKDIFSGFLQSFEEEYDGTNEYMQQKNEFKKDTEFDLLTYIAVLKKSKLYADLGDYYLACSYLFDLINNGKSPEMNQAIGLEMLTTFGYLNNNYVNDIYSAIKNKPKLNSHLHTV